MKYFLPTTLIFCTLTFPSLAVSITEGSYEGAEQFIIKTKIATYYLDKEGGGLSRMIDREGNDWIAFHRDPWEVYPQSAASSYRGMPNFVFLSDDAGAGHPGYRKCYSFKVNKNTILTISKSGLWQWRWEFFKHYATVTIEKTDDRTKYWFMYEGPIAGKFQPEFEYWGNNLGGPRTEHNDYFKDDKIFANWLWSYFGDKRLKRILFVAMAKPDRHIDTFSYLGNSEQGINSTDGMVVFGFGRRANAEPMLTETNNRFVFGFLHKRVRNESGHDSVAKDIQGYLR